MADHNHYDTLHLNPAASQAEIKQSYRRLVKLFHPDSNSETADHHQIVRINAAYEILSDPQKRQSYDQQLCVRLKATPKTRQQTRQQRTAAVQNNTTPRGKQDGMLMSN
jgi:molecular chaperone DnaJ